VLNIYKRIHMNTLPIIEGLTQNSVENTGAFDTSRFCVAYQNYLINNNSNPETVMNCIRNDMTMTKLSDAYAKLSTETKKAPFMESFVEGGPTIDDGSPLEHYKQNIVDARENINKKLKKIPNTTEEEDYITKYNSTMLISTFATIGGSCILYYVFMHLGD